MSKNQTVTPKQAQIKIASLLKGIDNSVVASNKHAKIINDNTKQVKTLLSSISNAKPVKPVAAKPVKKPAKPAKPAKKPVAAKPVKKPAKKPTKPVVAKPVKPVASKPVESKPVPAGKTAAVAGRPILKDAIKEILVANNNKAMPAAEIYKQTTAKYGYWSRQSLYNALEKSFTKTDQGYESKKDGSDAEVDNFVNKQIEKSGPAAAVGNVQ
jgi:hypothetical protein